MKTISIVLFLIFIHPAFGQSTNLSSKALVKDQQRPSSQTFTLEFLLASEQTKKIVSKSIDGTYTKFDISSLQNLSKDDQFRYFLATRYIDTKSDPSENMGNEFEMFFFEFMYRRKNILSQSRHGVSLTGELKNYWIIDDEIKKRYGYNGSFIPQVILKRRFGNSNSVSLKLRRHFFDTNTQDNYTLNFEDRAYLSLTNIFNRKFMLNNQIKYQHKQRKGNGPDYRFMELAEFGPYGRDFSNVPAAKKHQEILTLHTGISYFLNRRNMVELYAETKLSNTYDQRDLATISNDEFVFGTAFYLTAF